MLDGRQPSLEAQAAGAIADHAQATSAPSEDELASIAAFERTDAFFSSRELREFARGGDAPLLPYGDTAAEQRGRRFFEDLPSDATGKDGLCSACHSGPMLNQTNEFLPVPVPPGTRFIGVLVSELNAAANPVHDYLFDNGDGTETTVTSPDPGRALITGQAADANDFKIPSLRGIASTAPYFHDNSAKTLEAVAAHYAQFFAIVTTPPSNGSGPTEPAIVLTPEDQADIVAYMKLL
jgi:cytochrome c peroxidase